MRETVMVAMPAFSLAMLAAVVNCRLPFMGGGSSSWMVRVAMFGIPTLAPPVALESIRFTVSSGSSVASRIAREIGLPFVSRNVFIDHDDDPDVIAGQLRQVERLAERNGAVIAIGHPRPKTIEALREWLPGLGEKGLQLAPVTAVVLRSLEESGQDVSSR